jgi:hypothetical protein
MLYGTTALSPPSNAESVWHFSVRQAVFSRSFQKGRDATGSKTGIEAYQGAGESVSHRPAFHPEVGITRGKPLAYL